MTCPFHPDSPRYLRMMMAYYKIKYTQFSTDGILWLDRFVEEERQRVANNSQTI